MKVKTSRQVRRLQRLMSRQKTSAWTKNYKPATQATRSEAPSISQATIIRDTQKFGRDLHALSTTERDALLVALWHDKVIDTHEQKVLQPNRSPNPLTNFPLAKGMRLSDLRGMLDVFERMGAIDEYPEIILDVEGSSERISVPGLYEGDLLLYLSDEQGPYCINWTIKRTKDQFAVKNLGDTEFLQSSSDSKKVRIRHEAEEIYYRDAGIPTYQVTSEDLDKNIIRNLRTAYPWYSRSPTSLEQYSATAALLIKSAYGNGDTPFDLGQYFCRKIGISYDEWKHILYTLLWKRVINFDLTKPLYFDFPVKISPINNTESLTALLSRAEV